MLRGVNKVDGNPSMWRGPGGGREGCCGELSEGGDGCPIVGQWELQGWGW